MIHPERRNDSEEGQIMDIDGYSLWINGDSLLLVAPQVTAVERSAVLDSLLYAQLLANKQAGSRFTHPQAWYKAYRAAVVTEGWVLTQMRHAVETLTGSQQAVPVELLQAQVVAQCPVLSSLLSACVTRLERAQNLFGLDLLTRHAVEPGDRTIAHIACELAVVQPRGVISLARLSLDTQGVPGRRWLVDALSAKVLSGAIRLDGFSAGLDSKVFEKNRVNLAELMARKRKEHAYTARVTVLEGELRHE